MHIFNGVWCWGSFAYKIITPKNVPVAPVPCIQQGKFRSPNLKVPIKYVFQGQNTKGPWSSIIRIFNDISSWHQIPLKFNPHTCVGVINYECASCNPEKYVVDNLLKILFTKYTMTYRYRFRKHTMKALLFLDRPKSLWVCVFAFSVGTIVYDRGCRLWRWAFGMSKLRSGATCQLLPVSYSAYTHTLDHRRYQGHTFTSPVLLNRQYRIYRSSIKSLWSCSSSVSQYGRGHEMNLWTGCDTREI